MTKTTTSSDYPPAFDDVLTHVDALGFRSDVYGRSYLNRRVNARMRRLSITDHETYLQRLKTDSEEGLALLDALSVNVTSFFRNPEMWTTLTSVLQTIAEEQGSITAWCAPSSDGREPYSLAMLAAEVTDLNSRSISVLGTDIDPEALKTARAGVYTATRTTNLEGELAPFGAWRSYVSVDEDVFSINSDVKKLVTFERHDLVRDGKKSGFDLVFSRNLLIYIARQHKFPVVETLTDSLKVGGYLVIGLTETLPPELRDRFESVDKRHRIYRKVR